MLRDSAKIIVKIGTRALRVLIFLGTIENVN